MYLGYSISRLPSNQIWLPCNFKVRNFDSSTFEPWYETRLFHLQRKGFVLLTDHWLTKTITKWPYQELFFNVSVIPFVRFDLLIKGIIAPKICKRYPTIFSDSTTPIRRESRVSSNHPKVCIVCSPSSFPFYSILFINQPYRTKDLSLYISRIKTMASAANILQRQFKGLYNEK